MKLLIVTMPNELSSNRLVEEAKKRGIGVSKIFYSKSLKPKKIDGFDFCMLRDAYTIGKDFPDFLKTIFTVFKSHQLFDYKMYEKYPPYEGNQLGHPQDKLFQHFMYEKAVKVPKYWHFDAVDKVDIKSFPVVAKKRIGERGKEVFILKSENEIKRLFSEEPINEYFFEEFIDIDKDVRVLLLNHKVIGAVRRRIRFKDNRGYQGVGVKTVDKFEITKEAKEKTVEVSKILGSEFCGIDYAIDENNNYYLIECNVSPWFASTERILGINIAEKIIDLILQKQKAYGKSF